MQFKTAKWDELLSYWDKAVTEHPNDPDLLDMDGMTVTEVFEPYFRQMGLPVLKIKRNGLQYEIETDRFLFDEVKDKVNIIILSNLHSKRTSGFPKKFIRIQMACTIGGSR